MKRILRAAAPLLPALAWLLLSVPSSVRGETLRVRRGPDLLYPDTTLPTNGIVAWWRDEPETTAARLIDSDDGFVDLVVFERIELRWGVIELAAPELPPPAGSYRLDLAVPGWDGFDWEWPERAEYVEIVDVPGAPPVLPELLDITAASDPVNSELPPNPQFWPTRSILDLSFSSPPALVLARQEGASEARVYTADPDRIVWFGTQPARTERIQLGAVGREGSFTGWSAPIEVYQPPSGCSERSERSEPLTLGALLLFCSGLGLRRRDRRSDYSGGTGRRYSR